MAFRLELITSSEESLALAWIEPTRYHIMLLLACYLIRPHREALVVSSSHPIHCRRVNPRVGAVVFLEVGLEEAVV